MKFKLLVISGHYKREGDGVVIQLFGRGEDGRSYTVFYDGFRPYFHIVEPKEDVRQILSADPEVLDLKERNLWYQGRDRNCLVVTIRFPFDVPKYRRKFQEKGYTILAADIPFIYRFFYDLDLGSYLEIEGEEIESVEFTTDVVMKASSLKRIEPFNVRLKVLSFDIENSIKSGELYMVGHSTSWLQLEDGEKFDTGNIVPGPDMEEQMEREDLVIQGLEDIIAEKDPDIITGYNIDGYDIPHILRRARTLSIEGIKMGRDGSLVDNQGFRSWRARGRIVVDAWWEAKKAFRPKKETLEAVSNMLFGEGKDDIDTAIIEEEWANRRNEVIKYCERDAELALMVLDRTLAVKRSLALSYVAKIPLFDIMSGTTSTMIDSILIREADRKDIGIPMTRRETKTSKIEGAYVHSIEPGLYHWVIVLDFRSMYPSLMIENNICFTTLTGQSDENISSPIPGIFFLKPGERKGLVPSILEKLMDDRQKAKTAMKGSGDPKEREYFNSLQEAIKVLMNSFYGVFASYFYRFTDRSIGSSITAYARENIKSIISTLMEEGMEVIYSDTDSVFVRSPGNDLKSTLEAGKQLSSRFSDGARVLEFEKVFSSFFTHGKKKRYVGKVVWPSQDLIVRGYEMRRTDSFDLQGEALSKVFDLILDGKKEQALDYARSVVAKIREGDVPDDKLVISRSVQEVEEDRIREKYKNPDSMANIQALRKARKLGLELVPGMKVSWIVVDARAKPQRVEPYINEVDPEIKPDHNYYAERLASTLSRVTEVFGVSEKELLSGVQQSSLFDDFSAAKSPPSDEDRKNNKKKKKKETEDAYDNDEGDKDSGPVTLDRWM